MTNTQISIEIDKLTRSIEHVISGNSFKTDVLELLEKDIKHLKKTDWIFNWKKEAKDKMKIVFKLVIINDSDINQGLISLEKRGDHIFMHLIESNKINRGIHKLYLGVPGNLVAFACKISFDNGYDGYVSFESKTNLIEHYKKTLGADILFNNIMAINSKAALKLIDQYFTKTT